MLEHNSHVVLGPRADVDQDAGGAGGAEAEHQLLFSQVGSAQEADSCPALGFSQRKIGSLWEEIITNQGPCLKVPAHVYNTQVRESHSNGGGQRQTFVEQMKNKCDVFFLTVHTRAIVSRCSASSLVSNLGVTVSAEGSVVRRARAVAGVPVVLFHARPSVPTVRPVAAAVALAAWTHACTRLCFALQVKGDAVYFQSSHAAQEAPLPAGSTWKGTKNQIKEMMVPQTAAASVKNVTFHTNISASLKN